MSIITQKEKWYHGHIMKFLSVSISIFLWFYVVNSEPVQVDRDFHISVISPKSFSTSKMSVGKVKLTLKGARAFLKDYKKDALEVKIDLSKIKSASKGHSYEFKKSDFALPFGVDIVSFSPERVRVNFDKLIKKKVPIKVVFADNLPKDLKLVSFKTNPRKIMIEGPRSQMKKTGQLKSMPVDLSNLSGKNEIPLQLDTLPQYINLEKEEKVSLKYDIRPKKANLTLKRIPILFISKDSKFKSSTRYVSVDVLASEDKIIKKSEVQIYAKLPLTGKGNFRIKLEAKLPDEVHLLKINPSLIRVRKY